MRTKRALHPLWSVVVGIVLIATACPSLAQEAEPPPAEQAPPAEPPVAEPPPEEEGTAGTMGAPTDIAPSTTPSSLSAAGDIQNFQADLFTGRFTYGVPIVVPPGRQGSQPGVGLAYNSSGGSGWCGVGWSLDMGYIQRETRFGVPRKWSGASPANEYDDGYGFMVSFGGVMTPLVNVTNNEYRAEVDNGAFLKFELLYSGTTTNQWKITDKASNTVFFGEASASRMENTKFSAATGSAKVFRWAISKKQDLNGNQTTFQYTTISNSLYLTNIWYNLHTAGGISSTNRVSFHLEDRSDNSITFLPAYRVETRKRLKEVQVRVGSSLVRRYELAYTNSPSTSRSLLTSVRMYGSDSNSVLPAQTFTYQTQTPSFGPEITWSNVYSQGESGASWNSIRSSDGNSDYRLELMDFDGDALPDRVMRKNVNPFTDYWAVQYNTGEMAQPLKHSFWPTNSNYQITPLHSLDTSESWNSVRRVNNNDTHVELADINGDLLPDRVLRPVNTPFTNWWIQYNWGTNSLSVTNRWGAITNETGSTDGAWDSVRGGSSQNKRVDLIDMNGDGLLDRVMRKWQNPLTNYFNVQFNLGGGFGSMVQFGPLYCHPSQENDDTWNSIYGQDGSANTKQGLWDINGDGLPDRVLRQASSPYSNFQVQLNNGAGFEPVENWGPLNNLGDANSDAYNSPVATGSGNTFVTLADINGDALLDRVMRTNASPYNKFVVQINNGSGFNSTTLTWTNVSSQGQTDNEWNSIVKTGSGDTQVDFLDINGDALPDRIMRTNASPYSKFVVQLNQGPFPDLLSTIHNGIGGKVQVTYIPSTQIDNRHKAWTGNPWSNNALSLLPFPVYVVTNITTIDGAAYLTSTNTTSYAFSNGMFDPERREFRGFHRAQVTDPLGARTITFFHQGGGYDGTTNGEYQDSVSHAKKGLPYRIEIIGTDNKTNSITLNKVEVRTIHSNTVTGLTWSFPFASQIIQMEYETNTTYKAVARQFFYHAANNLLTSTGNLTNEVNYGEVVSVVVTNQTFTDSGSDTLYTMMWYDNLARVTNIFITTSSSGATTNRLTRFTYDTKGNKLSNAAWLNPGNTFLTDTLAYDSYGNVTNTTDRVGITTKIVYESTHQTFPFVTTVGGSFVTTNYVDARSGAVTNSVDVKNFKADTIYDVFFRPLTNRIATTTNVAPSLVRSIYEYGLGGMGTTGLSTNYVRQQINDPSEANGFHNTYTYFDGLGRTIQSRVESEVSSQYRVTEGFYDERGKPEFTTYPFFSSGTAMTARNDARIGTLTIYDPIGRVSKTTIANAPSENGSPVGTNTVAYVDGANPWAVVTTDAEGKVRKSYHDAYGRTTNIIEVVSGSNFSTVFKYTIIGDLTNTTDNAGNVTSMTYDSLSRKTGMTDPDMGAWSYQYDAASRLTNQVDARNNRIALFYESTNLGRLTSKIINPGAGAVTNTFTYDSGDADHAVFKGQLFKVKDRQGEQKNSYDGRGRVTKTTRSVIFGTTTNNFITTSAYDDADRSTNVVYPGNATKLKYTYDTGLNLKKVEALCGTGATNEVFYTLLGLNAAGQTTNFTYASGVTNIFTYYTNSLRVSSMRAVKGATTNQNLSYTYDKVSNLKTLTNHVTAYTGNASATLSAITYDDLHRLTSYIHNTTTNRFAYDTIGNVVTNGEFGTGKYTYGAQPHAVTNANSKSYRYDACGNMTNRNGATLVYDEENQLKQYVHGAGTNMFYGYAEGGQRLWSSNGITGSVTFYIGGIYELRGSTELCHVFAGSRRISTFESDGTVCAWLRRESPLFAAAYGYSTWLLTWPFIEGRTPWTLCLLILFGVLSVSVLSRWRERLACGVFWLRIWWRNGHKKAQEGTRISRLFSWLFVLLRGQQPGSSLFRALLRDFRECGSRLRATTGSGDSWFDVQSSAFDVRRSRRFFPRFAVSLTSVVLTVALFLAFMPHHVHAAAPCTPLFFYYHNDHLGSSNVITDRSGTLADHYEYTAFGKERYNDATCALPISHRYTGQILDEETGLYYYNARYYDPELARFTQADTIVPGAGNSQNFNRYSYVNNNPLMYTDPSGNFAFAAPLVIGAIGAAVGAGVAASQNRSILAGAATGAILGGVLGSGSLSVGGTGSGLSAVVGAAAGGAAGGVLPSQAQQIIISAYIAAVIAVAGVYTMGLIWALGPATLGAAMSAASASAPVVASAAAATDVVLNIPPVARALDGAGFWARFGASLALTFAFQLGFSYLIYPEPPPTMTLEEGIQAEIRARGLTGVEARRYAIRRYAEILNFGGQNYGGIPGSGMNVDRVFFEGGRIVGTISRGSVFGLPGEHTGVAFANIGSTVQLPGFAPEFGYLSFGISHQAVGRTFLQAGYSGSILTHGGGFVRYLSSAAYGPYGGSAFQALYNARGAL